MAVQVDSVVLLEATSPGAGRCSSSPTKHSPACNRCCPMTAGAASLAGPPRGAGRHPVEVAHRPAWGDVPGRVGPWQTCYGRLRRWQTDGTWPRVWAVLAAELADSPGDRRGQALLAAAPVAAAGTGLVAAPPHRHHSTWRPLGGVHHTRRPAAGAPRRWRP